MGALIGFVLGYVLGAKAGPDKIAKAWDDISNTDELKGLLTTATAWVQQALAQGRDALVGDLASGGDRSDQRRGGTAGPAGEGSLRDVLERIAGSEEVRALTSNAAKLVADVLEQGSALLTQQLRDAQRRRS